MSANDPAAPIESLLRHRPWVRAVARALVRDDHDADDLEQETWLAAARRPPPDGRSPRAWLGTVLRRTAAKLGLKDARREARERAVAREEPDSAVDLVAEAEMHERVVRSVLALPEPYRSTILRRYFDGLSTREIAERTGAPLGTVRARLSRGLGLLRSELRGGDAGAWPATLIALAGSQVVPAGGAAAATATGVVLMTQAKASALAVAAVVAVVGVIGWLVVRERAAPPEAGSSARSLEVEPALPTRATPAPPEPKIVPRPVDSDTDGRESGSRPGGLTGTVVVKVIWADDRTPAEGVWVWLVEFGTRTGIWRTRWAAVPANGVITMTDVVPGRVVAYGDRGGSEGAQIAAGELKELTVEIPPGPTVEGQVVALDGTPVGGADIWMSTYGNWRLGTTVTNADVRGRFVLRSVQPMHAFAARAPGHAQSEVRQLDSGKRGEVVKIVLELGGPAGSVRGVVRGPDGAAVAGAVVHLGIFAALEATTDANGAFAIGSVSPGENRIEVRRAGFAPWSGSAQVKVGEVADVEVRLRKESAITGVVRLASGEPAAEATIWVGRREAFLSSVTNSAADGSFRIGSLAPGSIEVSAELKKTGKASAKLECAEGAEVRWDPVLDHGMRIVGAVRDEAGRPCAGWLVHAERSGAPSDWYGSAKTDETGKFAIPNCPERAPYRLKVYEGTSIGRGVRQLVEDVMPEEERVIVVSSMSVASLKGRLVLPDGSAVPATIRLLSGTERGHVEFASDPKTGAFSRESVPPGRWRIALYREPAGIVDLGERDLPAGSVVDLGDIVLDAPGTLAIDVVDPDHVAGQAVWSIMPEVPRSEGRIPMWILGALKIKNEDLARPLELPTGSYSLSVSGPRVERTWERFRVEPGQETRVKVSLRGGVSCELVFSSPEGEGSASVSFTLTPVGGRQSVSGEARRSDGESGKCIGRCVVQPGIWDLLARSDTGLEKRAQVTIEEGKPSVQLIFTLESPWPADGLPVTLRFKMPKGQERHYVYYFLLDVDSGKPVGEQMRSVVREGANESRIRLLPGSYAVIVTTPMQPKRRPFVVKPGEKDQVFEFTIDPE